jgi:hypothetical protein
MRAMIDTIMSSDAIRHLGTMRYVADRHGFVWREGGDAVPSEKGVYFLLSPAGLEKVGSATGRGGLRQRLRGYTAGSTTLKDDPTNHRWHRVMTGPLAGAPIAVYGMTVSDEVARVETPFGPMTLPFNATLALEAALFRLASAGEPSKHPMRLAGAAP